MEIPNDRYNRWHSYGNVHFYLSDCEVDSEQARFILLKVIEQTIRDFVTLAHSPIASEQQLWLTAEAFLFDDDYIINWGDIEINLEEALMMLGLDISWVRKETRKKFKEQYGDEYTDR